MDNITVLLSELTIDSEIGDISSFPFSASCIGSGTIVCLSIVFIRLFIFYKKRTHKTNIINDNIDSEII